MNHKDTKDTKNLKFFFVSFVSLWFFRNSGITIHYFGV
jgi:hypothetical protein